MSSQEEYQRLKKLFEDGLADEARAAMWRFDWDGQFDYSRYPKEEREKSKRDYNFYIRESQIWRDKRAIRWMLDIYQCRACGGQQNLSVDHKDTSYDKLPFESIMYDLTTLCIGEGSCHDAITSCSRARRYSGKPVEVEVYTSNKPKGLVIHGRNEEIEVSPHRGLPHYFP